MPAVVYVANADSRDISVAHLDNATGALEVIQRAAVPGAVMPLAISPSRKFLYASLRSEPFSVATLEIDRPEPRYGERGVKFYSVIDGAFASMLLFLAAVNEGLGACFVAAFDDQAVSRVLGLPPAVRPIGLITIGVCAEGPRKAGRRKRETIVHHERW